ncbi:MAG: Gfo/Idh/MocA family oxidoreductase [Bifidobacteriaceae bacterium]|jgi:predicted dehydrogenase|nr:Gfo/Idh/MocA family oxidoreductase [Bifidobacteriaceae bacterium]
MESLRVALIGAGPVAQAIHIPTIARLAGRCQVSAVMDPNAELANAVAQPLGATAYDSLDAMLADQPFDIAVVGSPDQFHAAQVIRLAAAKVRGIMAEKPLATSARQAQDIARAVRQAGSKLVVGAMHTFDPAWLALSQELARCGVTAAHGPFHVSLVCHIPANSHFEDMANLMVRPAAVPPAPPASATAPPASKSAPEPEPAAPVSGAARMVRHGVLGLAIHNLPHIRRFIPVINQVHYAAAVLPWGYSITASGPGGTADLLARTGGTWQPDWTLRVYGQEMVAQVAFPPSYVHGGSATSRLAIGSGPARSFGPYIHNGYQAEWAELLAQMNGKPPLYPVEELVAELEYALNLAALAENAAAKGVSQ